MESHKNTIKSKARMVVRTVFRGKRRLHSFESTSHKSTLKLANNNIEQESKTNVLPLKVLSKETVIVEKSKLKDLLKTYNKNKRESLSLDNILKGTKIDNEKLVLLLNENDKLKKKVKNQNRLIEDLKRQLNSERSVYEGKIEYLNAISDTSCETREKSSKNVSVASQTNTVEHNFSPEIRYSQPDEGIETLKRQLYKQTLVTKCVCSKYIKLNNYKDDLMQKLAKTDSFYKVFVNDIMQNFEECRISFALSKSDHLDKGNINQLIDKNAKLAYNNAAMQLELFRLEKEIKSVKSAPIIPYKDDDVDIIKSVKAKSNEYCLERRPSSFGSISSTSYPIKSRIFNSSIDETLSSFGGDPIPPKQQISICGTVISVPVTVVNNGKVTYRMTPMFETVTDLQEVQQPVSVTCDSRSIKMLENTPDLVSPSQLLINEENKKN